MDLHTHLADAGQSADLALPIKTSPAATALIGAHNARLTLEAGFTTVRDVGTYRGLTDVALRDAINAGLVPGPRMFVAGAYLTHPGGGGELNGVVPNDELPADMRLGVLTGADQAAAKELEVRGTPSFFINGRRIIGMQGIAQFRAAIDAALAELHQVRILAASRHSREPPARVGRGP